MLLISNIPHHHRSLVAKIVPIKAYLSITDE